MSVECKVRSFPVVFQTSLADLRVWSADDEFRMSKYRYGAYRCSATVLVRPIAVFQISLMMVVVVVIGTFFFQSCVNRPMWCTPEPCSSMDVIVILGSA